jgi:hypothetical protein
MSDDSEPITVEIEGEGDAVASSSTRREKHRSPVQGNPAREYLLAAEVRRAKEKVETANYLMTVKSEAQAAEHAFEQANEMGDYKAAAREARRLAAAATRETAAEAHSQALESTRPTTGNPFEDHLANFTDRTAAWMREHPDWVTDPRKNAKLTGAHHLAVSEGLTPDTDSYEAFVEKTIGLRGGNGNGSSRNGGNMRVESKINPGDHRTHVTDDGRVYLTENEKKIATDGTLTFSHGPNKGKPLGIKEFARRKAELHKQGMYDRLG